MSKPLLGLAFFILAICHLGFAQVNVTGTVTSEEDNTSQPGVNVVIKGTSKGTITDVDGNYKISVPSPESVLVFSFVGFQQKEVTVGNQTVIDVSLANDLQSLNEVVVVGYGTQTKEQLTGAVDIVSAEKLEQAPTPSFQDVLQGNSPGLQVVSTDGSPGGNVAIRVRGIGSINASNDPLYVIDGIPVSSGDLTQTDFGNDDRSANVLASLNPNDIESVTVLKDAASTAIYGSRGANGVILITTKNGKSGKSMIDLKTQIGFTDFAYNNWLESLNRDQYTELYVEGYVNQGETEEQAMARFNQQFPENANTNWLDELRRIGLMQQYDLSASGGTDKLTYFASGSYFNQEGTIIGMDFERYSTRLNLNAKLTDKLTLSNNLNLSYFTQTGMTDGTRWQAPMYGAYLVPPTVPIKDELGQYYGDHDFLMGGNNPVGTQSGDDARELTQLRIIDNLSASYKILDDLTFKTAWNFDIININEFIFQNARYGDGRNVGGIGSLARQTQISWLGTQTLTYGKTFNGVHNFDALLGYEAQKTRRDIAETSAEGYPSATLRTLENAANPTLSESRILEYAFSSFFSRVNYDYNDTYFLSLSYRTDGSSRFGPEKRWGNFWSVGSGITLNNMEFMESASFVNFLKVRASYGVTGNAGIGNFDWAGLYSFDREYDGSPGSAPSQVGNPVLTWESQNNFNIGLDFTVFSRLNGTVDYFERKSTDLLLERPLSLTSGFRNITENVGDMTNKGVELNLNADIVSSNHFTWNLGGNVTFLKNRITKLPASILDGTNNRQEGHDFQEYYLYGWAGVNPDDGAPLWYTDSTQTEVTSNINEAVRYFTGKTATPKVYGGLNTTLTYKGISLSAQFNYQFGNYVYDGPGWVIHGDGRFTPRSTSVYAYENRWQEPGDNAKFPKFVWGNTSASNTQNSSRYLFDGDYIRLRKVNLSYNFPASILESINIRSLKAYVSLSNYWTWVKDKDLYFDPEQAINGVYNTVSPINKTATIGINIGL